MKENFDSYLVKLNQQSRVAERALIGSLIVNNELYNQVTINIDDFNNTYICRPLFKCIIKLFNEGKPFDPIFLGKEMKALTGEERMADISALIDAVPKSTNIEHYNNLVKEMSIRRKLLMGFNNIFDNILQGDIEEIRDDSENLISQVFEPERLSGNDMIFSDDQLLRYKEHLENMDKNLIKLGFPTLDNAFGGILGGEVVTILGRPSVGKSALKQNIISNIAQNYDCGIMSFELEMPQVQFTERQLQIDSNLERYQVIDAVKNVDDRLNLTKYRLKYRNLIVIDKPVSLNDIKRLIKRANSLKTVLPIKIIFIDHLVYIHEPGDEYEKITAAFPRFKQLAKSLNIIVFVLHHPHREERDKGGYKPLSVASGRGSGAIENNSDFVIGVYREELDPDLSNPSREMVRDKLNIQILKNKRGNCGNYDNFMFNKSQMSIKEITENH